MSNPLKLNDKSFSSTELTKNSDTNVMATTLKRKRDSKSPSTKLILESHLTDLKNNSTTATILVSKTKTKTGLPLMIRKE